MKNKEETIAQYFLAELNLLENRATRFEENKSNRINFFILLFGITLAGVTSGMQSEVVRENSQLIITYISFVLLVIGLLSLNSQIEYSITIVTLYRKSGRIRRWFLDNNKEIAPYLIFEPADDKPSYIRHKLSLSWRGAEPTLVILNAVLITTLLISLFGYRLLNSDFYIFLVLCFVLFFLSYFIQIFWIQFKLNDLQKRRNIIDKNINRVIFPFDDKIMTAMIEKSLKEQKKNKKSQKGK
ncbi:MAG: hypothetical protein JXI43_01965 [Tissierellales bacterium]|nr:hypothetical protein [Tissierellales bacterium]